MITIKKKEDIQILREGGKRHAFILSQIAEHVRPQVETRELNVLAERLIAEGGDKSAFLNFTPSGAKRPYPAALCVSVNEEVVHGIPNENNKILKEGDIVSLDLGLIHKGLFTDAAITVPVGKVKPELQELIDNTKQSLLAGIKAAKEGNHVNDISIAIERIALAKKYGIVEELAGHGVGYGVHEEPYIPNFSSDHEGPLLKQGMVIAIEPMFNIGTGDVVLDTDGYTYKTADGLPSAHFEHTILITKGKAEILTA